MIAGAACRPAPIAGCDDDLRGVYAVDGAPGERWMMLDDGATLEAYPIVPDVLAGAARPDGAAGLEVAPRMLELTRQRGAPPAGLLQRRYLQRSARCDARAAVHVTRCTADGLELVVAGDPALPPPPSIAPCQLGVSSPSRVVRWRRP
ncbi:MAG TPA: hypothetical protein VGC42_27765 [Kofleriaceae bacterium]